MNQYTIIGDKLPSFMENNTPSECLHQLTATNVERVIFINPKNPKTTGIIHHLVSAYQRITKTTHVPTTFPELIVVQNDQVLFYYNH